MDPNPLPKGKEELSPRGLRRTSNRLISLEHIAAPTIDQAETEIRQAIAYLARKDHDGDWQGKVDPKATIQPIFTIYPKLFEKIGKDLTISLAHLIPLAECFFEAFQFLTGAQKRKLIPLPSKENNRLLCLLYVMNGTMAESVLGVRCWKLTREFQEYTQAYRCAVKKVQMENGIRIPKADPIAKCISRYPKNAGHWLNAIATVQQCCPDTTVFRYLRHCRLPLIENGEDLQCHRASYYGLFFSDDSNEPRYAKAIRILKDYTNRFKNLTVHWGRTHTKAVRDFLDQEPTDINEKTLDKLIARLKVAFEDLDMEMDTSLTRRLKFIFGIQQGQPHTYESSEDEDAYEEDFPLGKMTEEPRRKKNSSEDFSF